MYTYTALSDDIGYLAAHCVDTGSIGESTVGRRIPYIHVGGIAGKQLIVTGGIHAREHVSSLLVMRQVVAVLNDFPEKELLHNGIYFIPMLNPDGNLLCANGVSSVPNRFRERLIAANGGEDFSLFKANANCVDLNVNFDARWGEGKFNVRVPSGANYIGTRPFSEKETRAIRDFTLRVRPVATLSYHAMGRELYWQFGQSGQDMRRDTRIAEYINGFLGYRLVPDNGLSTGGYKDWCIRTLKIPSFTAEIVSDKEYSHPLTDDSCIDEDFEKNKQLPQNLLKFVASIV